MQLSILQSGLRMAALLSVSVTLACSNTDKMQAPSSTLNPTSTPAVALDGDGDGIANGQDNCNFVFNPNQLDTNNDGQGNACDDDDDGDGKADTIDNCPLVVNADQRDSDSNSAAADGVGDACDDDDDGDGVGDATDNCRVVANPPLAGQSNQSDLDKDGLGDACDTDRDGDGVENSQDNCADEFNPGQSAIDCGVVNPPAAADADRDGVPNDEDNCPNIRNDSQRDFDEDGRGDACDNCPSVQNPSELDDEGNLVQPDADNDRIGDACEIEDPDDDGVPTYLIDGDGNGVNDISQGIELTPHDNCPLTFNPDQRNSDFFGAGDACECDFDADSIDDPADFNPFGEGGSSSCNGVDNCPLLANSDQCDGVVAGPCGIEELNSEGSPRNDGVGDQCDTCPALYNPPVNGAPQPDSDGDGLGDECDVCPELAGTTQLDSDGDGFGDECDTCPSIANPDQEETCPVDSDQDSVFDSADNCPVIPNGPSDADNQLDADSDNVGDACDNCISAANEDQNNADQDTFGDTCDNCVTVTNEDQLNSDTDSLGDVCDNCVSADNEDQLNSDTDSFGDACDNCPLISNEDQADADNDTFGDACDGDCFDWDSDGVSNEDDACPQDPARTAAPCATPAGDGDEDGVADGQDNCPSVANSDQADSDGTEDFDRVGDACEAGAEPAQDWDNDGVVNDIDNCRFVANPLQEDDDGDGVGSACDICPAISNQSQDDTDLDGIGDACDACPQVDQAINGSCLLNTTNSCTIADPVPALALMLIVDRSGSMGTIDTAGFPGTTRMDELKLALNTQLARLLPSRDFSGLVSYASAATMDKALDALHVAAMPPAGDSTAEEVDSLAPGGGTNSDPAIRLAAAQFLADSVDCSDTSLVECIVIHLTDGRDNNPDTNPEDAAQEAKEAGIEFFVIGIGLEGDGQNEVDKDALQTQASDASHYYNAVDAADLDDDLDSIFDNLLNRFNSKSAFKMASSRSGKGLWNQSAGAMREYTY